MKMRVTEVVAICAIGFGLGFLNGWLCGDKRGWEEGFKFGVTVGKIDGIKECADILLNSVDLNDHIDG